jgi:hypothetical protein
LGAFGCGAFKSLAGNGIKFDIVARTSIGAVNAAIIAGSRSGNPAKDLEDFWIEVAASSYTFFPEWFFPVYDIESGRFDMKRIPTAAMNAALFGVPKIFVPRIMTAAQWFGASSGHTVENVLAMASFIEEFVNSGRQMKPNCMSGSDSDPGLNTHVTCSSPAPRSWFSITSYSRSRPI